MNQRSRFADAVTWCMVAAGQRPVEFCLVGLVVIFLGVLIVRFFHWL